MLYSLRKRAFSSLFSTFMFSSFYGRSGSGVKTALPSSVMTTYLHHIISPFPQMIKSIPVRAYEDHTQIFGKVAYKGVDESVWVEFGQTYW